MTSLLDLLYCKCLAVAASPALRPHHRCHSNSPRRPFSGTRSSTLSDPNQYQAFSRLPPHLPLLARSATPPHTLPHERTIHSRKRSCHSRQHLLSQSKSTRMQISISTAQPLHLTSFCSHITYRPRLNLHLCSISHHSSIRTSTSLAGLHSLVRWPPWPRHIMRTKLNNFNTSSSSPPPAAMKSILVPLHSEWRSRQARPPTSTLCSNTPAI